MKVTNLSNILASIQPLATDNNVEVVVDVMKRRSNLAITKVGDVFFQMAFDEIDKEVVAGSTLRIDIASGEAFLTDAPLVTERTVSSTTARKPGRSCSAPMRNSDML